MHPEHSAVPAVYVQILGGLANQMFQYAAGRSLADRLRCPLKLDLTGFRTYERWPYRLDLFPIEDPVAPAAELEYLFPRKSPLKRFIEKRILGRRNQPRNEGVFQEPHWHFTPDLFAQRPPVWLHGYWQSSKYFDSIRAYLLDTFVMRAPVSDPSRAVLRRMQDTMSVSVHVRRGDYVRDPHVSRIHGTCSIEYYRRAISLMRSLHGDVTFFVFSDDPDYVRSRFEFCPGYHLVEGNCDVPVEDLFLMSRCRHHIVANSSFSWWGAWLNPGSDKTVIAPRRWFSDETLQHTFTYDLYPDGWITIA